MAFHITPHMMEAGYDYLRTTPPFRGWHMPPAEEVTFHVFAGHIHGADYLKTAQGHRIRMNSNWVGSTQSLMKNLMHEMVHLHLEIACPTDQAHHGQRFKRKAALVCRYHCLDPKTF